MPIVQECLNCEKPFTNSVYGYYCSVECKDEFTSILEAGAVLSTERGLQDPNRLETPQSIANKILNQFAMRSPLNK